MVPSSARNTSPLLRPAMGVMLLAAYALPLLWPPGPGTEPVDADAGFWTRLFPIVPAWWIVGRLAALAAGAWLLARPLAPRPGWVGWGPAPVDSGAGDRAAGSSAGPPPVPDGATPAPARAGPGEEGAETAATTPATASLGRHRAGLAFAVLLALASPWTAHLPPPAQSLVLVALFAPCALLTVPGGARRTRRRAERAARSAIAWLVALTILGWIGLTVLVDVGGPRGADIVDGWRAWVDMIVFVERGKSILGDLIDPELPGLGSTMLFFHGLPFFQAGLLPLRVETAELFQIGWIAVCAAGFALLVTRIVDRRAAPVAVAILLFSPYMRFCAALPGPFLLGPVYGTALLLATFSACRHRSDAGLAALGALSGLALLFPGVIPVAGSLVLLTLWQLRRDLPARWRGLAAGFACFLAAAVPHIENLLALAQMTQHLRLHGILALLEPSVMGQLPVGAGGRARELIVWRPLDIVAGALLAPFAHPRLALRLWGDSLFDPLGGSLVAVGAIACARSAGHSARARFFILLYGVMLLPAFVSPVDRVDIVHAVVFPIPAVLLAAVGFDVLRRQLPEEVPWRWAPALATVCAAVGGTWLVDFVQPRILSASAGGILFRALQPEAARRAIVLDYPPGHSVDVRWLLVGPASAFGGKRPIGYLPYPGGALPADELAAEGKDLLFWSPGLGEDLKVREAVCSAWPSASLFEIHDRAGLGRVFAARVGITAWQPRLPSELWSEGACTPPKA